tara:strand:- start:5139 stop:5717 length:579 start_codon:yes stop_codon:yes gene_type:complete
MGNQYLPPSGSSISTSCMNIVRKCKLNQTTVTPTSPNSIADSTNFYKNKANMPNSTGAATNQKFSNFNDASIVSGTVITRSETWSTYADTNDGAIEAYIDCDSIVTKNNEKVYNFSRSSGTYIEKVENINTPNTNCRCYRWGGLSSGINKIVYIRDGLNHAAGQNPAGGYTTVGYNDNARVYCIQRFIVNRV